MTEETAAPAARFRVLIVGGGVAALEAALALHDFAADQVTITLLAPNREIVYRPLGVRDPFARRGTVSFPLSPILEPAGVRQHVGSLRWIDPHLQLVYTDAGEPLRYDAVLLALGARQWARYPRALTLDPLRLDEQLHGIVTDVEAGSVRRVAFVIPPGRYWPLPVYELALMLAGRAAAMGQAPEISIVTPESTPLGIFGEPASLAVADLLAASGIRLHTSASAHVRPGGQIGLRGEGRDLHADTVIALPELVGPSVAGLPASALHGFVATDPHGRVRHLQHVFAAGDMTDFPVKQGAIAAQQARSVAQELAAEAGVATVCEPFEPILHGVLLGGVRPLYLRARLVGGWAATSEVSDTQLWDGSEKIHAPYLTRAIGELRGPDISTDALAPV